VSTQPGTVQTYQRYRWCTKSGRWQRPGYLAIGADEWLPETAVALINPALQQKPAEHLPLYLRQSGHPDIIVYNNCKLIFATLISSGKNSWTFEGRFAILYKVEYSSITPQPHRPAIIISKGCHTL